MKKILSLALICAICLSLSATTFAVDSYTFDAPTQANFGKATSTDELNPILIDPSVQTNKDAALVPPLFGSPTAAQPNSGEAFNPATSGSTDSEYSLPPANDIGNSDNIGNFTLPDSLFYDDGSLGALKIPSLNLSLKVYENESLESLAKGVGHFKTTSCWEGNIGLAGHNRGVNSNFRKIHTLKNGDFITYTTKLGTRTYKVTFVGQIAATDFSYLTRTNDNRITLITCVNDTPSLRWCIQAREV